MIATFLFLCTLGSAIYPREESHPLEILFPGLPIDPLTTSLGYTLIALGAYSVKHSRPLPKKKLHQTPTPQDKLIGVYLIQDGVFKFANPQLAELFGYEQKELLGKKVLDLVAPESRELVAKNIQERIDGKTQFIHYEFTGLRKDGKEFSVEVQGSRTLHEGRPAIHGTLIESSGLKTTEEEIKQLNDQIVDILDSMTDAFFSLDCQWRVKYINPRAEELLAKLSTKNQDLLSKNLWEEFPAAVGTNVYTELHRAMKENTSVHVEYFSTTLAAWFEVHAYPTDAGLSVYLRDITERKRSETAGLVEKIRFQQLFENAPLPIVMLDENDRVVDINKAFESVFQYGIEEIRGRSLNDLIIPDGFSEEASALSFRTLRGETIQKETMRRRKDGSLVHVQIYGVPIVLNHKAIGIFGMYVDMTARTKAEESLKSALSLLTTTLESTADGVLVVDEDGKLVRFNRNFIEMWRIPEAIVGSRGGGDALQFVAGQLKQPQEFLKTINGLSADPETESCDVVEFKDGRVFERYSRPRRIGQKHVGRVWSFRDITERTRVEAALRESEEKFRSLIENVPDGVYQSRPDGRLLMANPALIRMLGYDSEEELLAVDITRDLYVDATQRADLLRKLEEEGELRNSELTLRRKDGQLITVLENAHPVYSDEGKVMYYEGTLTEITERKHLEQQLMQAQKMDSIGRLAGGIAHDFNNILAIILAYTSRLRRGKVDAAGISDGLDSIKQAVQRGAGLVRQLLTFARKTDVLFESLNINSTIEELVKLLRETFPKTIRFSLKLDHQIPSIIADHNQIHQALLNLCVNARDAMSNHGTLSIKTETVSGDSLRRQFSDAREGLYVCASIADTGVGMDEATRCRIFEPFFTTKEGGSGTGLGLAVVYGIIKNHKGFIDVESELGKGTIIYLYLPVIQKAIATVEPFKQKDVPGGTETILIVEDEETLLRFLKASLEEKGYTVVTARDGSEGIEVYRRHIREIALVFTDMGLPILSGWQTFLKIKDINPEVKVILTSGYLDPNAKSELLKQGAKDYVQKPYEPEDLLFRIRQVLDTH